MCKGKQGRVLAENTENVFSLESCYESFPGRSPKEDLRHNEGFVIGFAIDFSG